MYEQARAISRLFWVLQVAIWREVIRTGGAGISVVQRGRVGKEG